MKIAPHALAVAWAQTHPPMSGSPKQPKAAGIVVPPSRKIGTDRGSSHGFWL